MRHVTRMDRRAARKWSASYLAVVVGVGCYGAHTEPRTLSDGGTVVVGADARLPDASVTPIPPTRDVDLLIVLDTRPEMAEERENLVAEMPRLIRILATGDFELDDDLTGPQDFVPAREIRIATVTADLGTHGVVTSGCGFGDGGLIGSPGVPECVGLPPVSTVPVAATDDDVDAAAASASCFVEYAGAGCSFAQPLEAALKALSPTAATGWTAPSYVAPVFEGMTTGHGDRENAGFADRNSILAIVFATNWDDCSTRDAALFDPSSDAFSSPLPLRCALEGDAALHSLERYVDGFLALRADPSRVIVSVVAGVPEDLVGNTGWDALTGPVGTIDPRLEPQIDPENPSSLLSSCHTAMGRSYPPTRLLAFAQRMEERGAGVEVASICNEGLRPLIDPIVAQLQR